MILRISPFDNCFGIQIVSGNDANSTGGSEVPKTSVPVPAFIPLNLTNTAGISLNFLDGDNQVSCPNMGSVEDLKNGNLTFFITAKDSQKIRSFKNKKYSISANVLRIDGVSDENGLAHGEWVEYEKAEESKFTKSFNSIQITINSTQAKIDSENASIKDLNSKITAGRKEINSLLDLVGTLESQAQDLKNKINELKNK